jgi:hypothetical protein
MKRLLLLLLAVGLISPSAAFAQAKPFLGASIGASFYNTSVEDVTGDDFKLDGSEFAWKIFGGARWGKFFAVEGDYRNMGEVQKTDNAVDLSTKTTAWDLFAAGHLNVDPLDLFAKAGLAFWRTDSKIDEAPFDVSGTDFAWGAGAALLFGGLGVRVEFERFTLDGGDSILMLSAGLSFGM